MRSLETRLKIHAWKGLFPFTPAAPQCSALEQKKGLE